MAAGLQYKSTLSLQGCGFVVRIHLVYANVPVTEQIIFQMQSVFRVTQWVRWY